MNRPASLSFEDFIDRCADFAQKNGMALGTGSNSHNPEDPTHLVEFNKGGDYFISLSYDPREQKPFQVFEAYIGWGEDTDTELWEYGNFKKLGNALNNTLTNSTDGRKPTRIWN